VALEGGLFMGYRLPGLSVSLCVFVPLSDPSLVRFSDFVL
jgi:hypothetical protein